MGWFTEKPVIWEFKKGWILLICFVFPFFLFWGIWYMGKKAKMSKMLRGLKGVFVLLGLNLLNFLLFIYKAKNNISVNDTFYMLFSMMLFCSFLFYSVILLGANTKEFLQRLHLKEFVRLDWVDYDYLTLVNNRQIREVKSIPKFIEELKRWDEIIVDIEVSNQIVKLISLMSKVNSIKEGQAVLFIERHVFSLTSLLRQFHQVELSKLESVSIDKIKEKLRDTLDIALQAIRQEILNEIKQHNRVAEVEADLYIESLRNEGLL